MNTTFVVIALVAVLTLLGVVAITIVTVPLQLQQAEARPNTAVKSCDFFGGAYNQSKGKCFNP
jgi:hypothetical protein